MGRISQLGLWVNYMRREGARYQILIFFSHLLLFILLALREDDMRFVDFFITKPFPRPISAPRIKNSLAVIEIKRR